MNASVGSFPSRGHRRKFRNPISCFRRRRYKPPGTPLLRWKFEERQRAYGGVEVSVRKLAAGLWQLRLLAQASDCGVKCGSCDRFRFQPRTGHVSLVLSSHCTSRGNGVGTKYLPGNPLLGRRLNHKHESSLSHLNSAMEGVTKWDPGCSKISTEAYWLYNHVKLLEDQVSTVSIVSSLQAELAQAQLKIRELEGEHRSFKKKFENLMRKLRKERNSCYIRKHRKMQAIIDDLKDELSEERKSVKQIEFLNSKFVKELAKAESSAKQFTQDYEEEKRARELLEEICNELAKKIGEDKAELEMLKSENMRIQEEVEKERNMLQLVEAWREERVKMKLVDAKLSFEHKYSQMTKLAEELESFLRSSAATPDVMALRKADLIRQAFKSVNIQECKEFKYVPPESESIFSMFEELRTAANEREMEVEPLTSGQAKDFDNNYVINYSNCFIACNNVLEEEFGACESSRHAEDQGSRCSVEGNDQGQVASKSIVMYKGNAGQHFPNTDIVAVCSVTGEELRQKACSVSQLRSDEGVKRVQNGTISSGVTMRKSADGGDSQRDSPGQFVSPNLGNPHITRGMKGFIEWPRVTRKKILKDKLLKAMMENQKTHLCKVLKKVI